MLQGIITKIQNQDTKTKSLKNKVLKTQAKTYDEVVSKTENKKLSNKQGKTGKEAKKLAGSKE